MARWRRPYREPARLLMHAVAVVAAVLVIWLVPVFRDGYRPFRSTGPLGHVALSGRDLDALAGRLDGMAREQNRRAVV